jgi:16S rRNA G527 N7-methylase RsmG
MMAGGSDVESYVTIAKLAAAFGLGEAQAAALARYADLMLAWRRGNVTALRTRAEIVSTLFGDALA